MTERAYENPVFVEDLVRNVALKLNAHPDMTWYKVEAENFESIHNHNAYASHREGLKRQRGSGGRRWSEPKNSLTIFSGLFAFVWLHSRTLIGTGGLGR